MPRPQKHDREKIAAIAMEAMELEIPVGHAISEIVGVSASMARYLLRAVKEDGFLGAPPHHPARAHIHRGTQQSRSWMVCEHCLNYWPCKDAFPHHPQQKRDPDDDTATSRARGRAQRARAARRGSRADRA